MFAKNKVSQSMIDAVNKIMSEKEVESKEEFLSEGWDEMLKSVKDKNKPQPSGGAGKKQGSRYGGSKQKEEPEEKEVKEQYQNPLEFSNKPKRTHSYDRMPDPKPKKYTGTSTSILGSDPKLGPKPQPKNEELKGNQHKIDKNKNNKIDAQDFKMLRKEELKGDQHKIDANKNNKIDAHDFQLLRGRKKVKEDTFAAKLLNSLDETRGAQAMKASGVKQSPDKLLARTGMNMAHKFPRAGQTNTRNIPAMNTPGNSPESDAYAEKRRGDRAKELKPAIKSALGTHGPKGKLPEEVELNEVSKSEVDHHYDDWINSTGAPYNSDAGDDKKVHDSAMRHLRNKYPPIPKEKHEKLAMHMAHLYHGSGIDESAPKKMDDVAKQNLEPAKKGVVGTVKSDFKNFKSFLAGKKETNEEVESLDEDMALFEAEQLFLESSPQEVVSTIQKIRKDVPKDAKEVHQHLDKAEEHFKSGNKMRGLFHATKFFLAARKYNMKEEVESLDEDRYLMKYLLSRGINPKYVDRNTRVGHAKSNEFKKWKADHLNSLIITRESNEMPFDAPYTKNKKDVKDKSGAVHTPMSRAKDLARSALKSVQDKTKIK